MAQIGFWPEPGTRILDYGCGEGGLMYRLLNLGFDAYGFDIHERAAYRSPEDRRRFGFLSTGTSEQTDQRIDRSTFRLPFPDDAFDVVLSTSVLEHVLDLAPVVAEIARVTRTDGITLHMYPSRASLIEPHMYVRLGTRIQSWPWLYLWASLGVRNEWQETPARSARTVANINRKYCRQGISYLPDRSIVQLFRRHFAPVAWADYAIRQRRSLREHAYYFLKTDLLLFLRWRFADKSLLRALARRQPLRAIFRDGKEGTRTCRIRTMRQRPLARRALLRKCSDIRKALSRLHGVLLFDSLPKTSRRTQGSGVVSHHSCPTSRRTKYKYSVSHSPLFR